MFRYSTEFPSDQDTTVTAQKHSARHVPVTEVGARVPYHPQTSSKHCSEQFKQQRYKGHKKPPNYQKVPLLKKSH